ncbi:MAG: YdcF family protein [Alphaproteobacteria bacterium]|nr:YdcF family protein [Alphaproteobacteria bacterium]MBV8547899.1 YdcF family protein [Alphaproteobacteria bacterium]
MSINRILRHGITGLGVIALVWGIGLSFFATRIHAMVTPVVDAAMPETDAVVVPTGGSERLQAGLAILKAGKARKLFISGVHAGVAKDLLLNGLDVTKTIRDCCIILGHEAGSTQGNADETQAWMELEGFHSLRLVTANYHMPRSILLFRRAMPDIVIIPHPVVPDKVMMHDWWQHAGTASLLVTEYNKYLWAVARPIVGE